MKRILKTVLFASAALVMLTPAAVLASTFDNFNDLDDTNNPTWTHLSGLVASTGQNWDASSGAYRLTAPNNGFSSLGFVGGYAGPSETDVTVSADVTAFIGPPAGGVFGVAARLNNNNAFNALKGYAYAYEPFSASGTGEVVLYKINGASIGDIGSQQVTLDANKDYRFVLEVIGNQLHGQLFDLSTNTMIAEKFAVDSVSPYTSGTSGLIAYSQAPSLPATDVTFDNFSSVSVPEPAAAVLMMLGLGMTLLKRRLRVAA